MNHPFSASEEINLGVERELAELMETRRFVDHSMPREVREILAYIHAHLFDDTLSVKVIRRSCRIGNHNVSSRFRLALGVSIGDYIKKLRMEVATRLLRDERLEIYRIGSVVGYLHQESFTRTFRRYYGCSPSAYRQQLLADDQEERSRASIKT
jgi:AraC-like DNA-binding protein